jgi:hypothetical protein
MQIQLIPTYSQSASLFDACLLFPIFFPLFTDQNHLIQDTSLHEVKVNINIVKDEWIHNM